MGAIRILPLLTLYRNHKNTVTSYLMWETLEYCLFSPCVGTIRILPLLSLCGNHYNIASSHLVRAIRILSLPHFVA